MMQYIQKAQLEKALEETLKKGISYIIEKVYNKLLDFIQMDIYDTYAPQKYERTFDFKNKAWQMDVKKTVHKIVGEIFYDGLKMSYNPAKYQHGNKWGEDRRLRLAEILNETVKKPDVYLNGGDWDMVRDPLPQPFWDHTLEWLNSEWNNLVNDMLSYVGLK